MSLTHTLRESYQTNGGVAVVSTNRNFSADAEVDIDVVVPAANTGSPLHVAVNLTYTQIVSMLLYSDQDIHVKTNSSSAPDDDITLSAGVSKIWNTDHVAADKPILHNVTAGFYLVNAGATNANFKMRILLNA